MDRIYILPMETVGDFRQPKYITVLGYAWAAIDYGTEPHCCALIRDISQVDHDALTANSDVLAAPENLDLNLTASAVTTMQSFLGAINVPSGWVNTSRTYRNVFKVLCGIFQFNQRWNGLRGNSPFSEGLNLDTTYSSLSAANQQTVMDVFDTMKVDRTSLTGASTIRDALQTFGLSMATRQLKIAGVVL